MSALLFALLLGQQAPQLTKDVFGPQRDPLGGVTYNADGRTLLAWSRGTSTFWDVEGRKSTGELGRQYTTTMGAFCRDGKLAAFLNAGNGGSPGMVLVKVTLVDPETRRETGTFSYEARGFFQYRMVFSADGKYLACGDVDDSPGAHGSQGTPGGKLVVWETATAKTIRVVPGNVTGIDFSPDGKLVALSGSDRAAKVVALDSGKVLKSFAVEMGEVNSARFSPDGQVLVAACIDHTVRTWTLKTGKPLKVMDGHTLEATDALFSRDGKYVFSGGSDETVRVWDAAKGKQLHVVKGFTKGAAGLDLHPDGTILAVACKDGSVRFVEGLPTK